MLMRAVGRVQVLGAGPATLDTSKEAARALRAIVSGETPPSQRCT